MALPDAEMSRSLDQVLQEQVVAPLLKLTRGAHSAIHPQREVIRDHHLVDFLNSVVASHFGAPLRQSPSDVTGSQASRVFAI